MRIAAIQHDIVWEDADATIRRLDPEVARAAATGAEVVLVSEMFSTGFSMATDRVAEPVDGPSATFLRRAAECHGLVVGGSIPTRLDDGRCVNRFLLTGPDGDRAHYDKIHPFSYGGEHEHYAAGDRLVTVDIAGVSCTLFVCYDLRFADEFWETAPSTEAYLVVANWPAGRRHHWQALLRARAIENQAWVVAVNRTGDDGSGLAHAGDSTVIDPLGEIVVSAGDAPTILSADIDPARVHEARERFPFLQDRR